MVWAMGHRWFGSKAASGLWQALVALMPPHAVYIETHLGGGAVMKRKPGALRNRGGPQSLDSLAAKIRVGFAVDHMLPDSIVFVFFLLKK